MNGCQHEPLEMKAIVGLHVKKGNGFTPVSVCRHCDCVYWPHAMSTPFTIDEAKSAVWAQVEDIPPMQQIALLEEMLADMRREYQPLRVKLEALSRDFADKALTVEGVHKDAWFTASKACWDLAKE